MKQLQVGDRVKIVNGGRDDEGTVLDVDERTEKVIVYLGRHVGGWVTATICGRSGRTDQGPRSVHNGRPTAVPFHARNLDWLKMKNPDAPAVQREAEEDWGRDRWR
jgi:ribosomal protein L24